MKNLKYAVFMIVLMAGLLMFFNNRTEEHEQQCAKRCKNIDMDYLFTPPTSKKIGPTGKYSSGRVGVVSQCECVEAGI